MLPFSTNIHTYMSHLCKLKIEHKWYKSSNPTGRKLLTQNVIMGVHTYITLGGSESRCSEIASEAILKPIYQLGLVRGRIEEGHLVVVRMQKVAQASF